MSKTVEVDEADKLHKRGGRPPALKAPDMARLLEIVERQPRATLAELAAELRRAGGPQVCGMTLRRALRAAGVVRLMPERRTFEAERATQGSRRYGYTAAHRARAGQRYSTDLTDREWALVADLFKRPSGTRGTPAQYERRALVEACCYVLRSGCAWRLLPSSFPPWQAVYKAFSHWARAGVFERMLDRLREQWRARMGRCEQPSAAVIDAQSTRISPQGGEAGWDGGKKVKGRKRHVVVDTLGLVLAVSVTAANVHDSAAAADLVAQAAAKAPSLQRLYADGAYSGATASGIEATHGIVVEITRPASDRHIGTLHDPARGAAPAVPRGFTVVPKRWVVERTHAWLERWRRLVMHHDRSSRTSVAWAWLASGRMLLSRLARTC